MGQPRPRPEVGGRILAADWINEAMDIKNKLKEMDIPLKFDRWSWRAVSNGEYIITFHNRGLLRKYIQPLKANLYCLTDIENPMKILEYKSEMEAPSHLPHSDTNVRDFNLICIAL